MKLVAISVIALLVSSGTAHADKKQARDLYERGVKAYNLGRFQEAITLLEEAYEEESSPAFLFNIAQAYRQLDDCERSVFFYKRYLSNDPKTKLRAEVEERIRELEVRCAEKKKIRERPPEGMQPPETKMPAPTSTATITASGAKKDEVRPKENPPAAAITMSPSPSTSARRFATFIEAGVGFPSFGASMTPPQLSIRIGGAIVVPLGETITLEPTLSASLTPLPWHEDAELSGAVAGNLIMRITPSRSFDMRLEVGAGVWMLSELEEGNPFTAAAARTSGPIALAHFRAGVGADYWISDAFALSVTPFAISFSPPKAGFRDDIKVIRQIDAIAGARLRW